MSASPLGCLGAPGKLQNTVCNRGPRLRYCVTAGSGIDVVIFCVPGSSVYPDDGLPLGAEDRVGRSALPLRVCRGQTGREWISQDGDRVWFGSE